MLRVTETIGVIGGGGMIGSHVVRKLLDWNYNVEVADNLSAYHFDQIKYYGDSRANYHKIDIRDKNLIDQFIKRCDRIIHLASLADVSACIKNPELNFDVDIVGTFNILESCRKNDIKKLVFASSASVYGSPKWFDGKPPKVSEVDCVYPTTTYANTKLFNETQMRLYNEHYNLPTISLRYFSVWGNNQQPKEGSHSWVIPIFIMKAIKNKPLTIIGDGEQIRDFTAVEDISEATVQSLFLDKANGRVFNVGTGIPTTIKQVAEEIKVFFPNIKITYINKVKGDPNGCYADNSLMEKTFGWKPTIKLQDKLEENVAYIVANKDKIPDFI